MTRFEVIPAIDIRDGRCVRLAQGDYARETVFADHPAEVAARWSAAGARTIHLVDLDGAKAGRPVNLEALAAIRAAVSCTLHWGGGLRDDTSIALARESGADRVVLGTALITRPEWVEALCREDADRIVLGIDSRDGMVATEGWKSGSSLTVEQAVARANRLGVRRALFTDIARDGMLEGPNLEALKSIANQARFEVIASGGVSNLQDLEAARSAGAAAAIIGRALYTGAIDLHDAIVSLSDSE